MVRRRRRHHRTQLTVVTVPLLFLKRLTQIPLLSTADMLCSLDKFSVLCSAVVTAGLTEELSTGTWTVFAPTNAAVQKLDPTFRDAVLSDPVALNNILGFHAVDHILYAEDLACTHLIRMFNGDDSRTVCKGSDVFQKGGGNPRTAMPKIIQADVGACNGVVHVINESVDSSCWFCLTQPHIRRSLTQLRDMLSA